MERFIKQNVCKFKLRVDSIMEVQGEGVGDLKPRCPERGKVEYLCDVQRGEEGVFSIFSVQGA